ncbi:hypothetical protein BJY04DRAFT_149921 [Aspergillus karnatakaensis]|uniref:protein slx4 n=1 Tax=Aspergillus karnatakaensis TaxID=1810916 RepID=UPI003CCD0A07
MATTADLIVLDSSPENNAVCTPPPAIARTKSTLLCAASSSPLPSPSELFRPPLRSRFFATSDREQPKTKSGTDSNAAPSEKETAPKLRKAKTGEQAKRCDVDQEVLGNKESTASKSKRTRKKADAGAGGEKLKNKTLTGKVGKAGAVKSKVSAAKPLYGQVPPKESREQIQEKGEAQDGECDDLHLEPAMKRRLDWTPSKDPVQPSIHLDAKDGTEGSQPGLGTLLSGYEYDGGVAASDRLQVLADSGPTKRRRIELVESRVIPLKPKALDSDAQSNGERTSQSPAASKPVQRPKQRAKRLTTLTARVTASYQQASAAGCEPAGQTPVAVQKPKARKSKKSADGSSGFKVPRTILLSPEAAVKSLDQQDLMFGTCSQLERADSPTLLRDTQRAILESEKEITAAPLSNFHRHLSHTNPSTALSRLATPKNLWSVAARDAEGLLVEVEVVDLLDTPEAPKAIIEYGDGGNQKHDEPGKVDALSTECDILPVEEPAVLNTSAVEELPAPITEPIEQPAATKPRVATKRKMPNYDNWKDTTLARDIKRFGLKEMKNRKRMIEVLKECWLASYGAGNDGGQGDEVPQRTEVALTTAASKLQKVEKPKKLEVQPLAEPTEPITEITTTSTTAISSSSTAERTLVAECQRLPTKPQKQPDSETSNTMKEAITQPKSTYSFIDVEEIQDSEDEFPPSPSRLFPSRPQKKPELLTSTVPSSPIPKAPSTLERNKRQNKRMPTSSICTKPGISPSQRPNLADQITKAVRSQPRANAAGKQKGLTWHEKILMYDPIFLEDFTAWLNTEGLGSVDEDREVGAGFVREWCEAKGICCCYKVKRPGRHY